MPLNNFLDQFRDTMSSGAAAPIDTESIDKNVRSTLAQQQADQQKGYQQAMKDAKAQQIQSLKDQGYEITHDANGNAMPKQAQADNGSMENVRRKFATDTYQGEKSGSYYQPDLKTGQLVKAQPKKVTDKQTGVVYNDYGRGFRTVDSIDPAVKQQQDDSNMLLQKHADLVKQHGVLKSQYPGTDGTVAYNKAKKDLTASDFLKDSKNPDDIAQYAQKQKAVDDAKPGADAVAAYRQKVNDNVAARQLILDHQKMVKAGLFTPDMRNQYQATQPQVAATAPPINPAAPDEKPEEEPEEEEKPTEQPQVAPEQPAQAAPVAAAPPIPAAAAQPAPTPAVAPVQGSNPQSTGQQASVNAKAAGAAIQSPTDLPNAPAATAAPPEPAKPVPVAASPAAPTPTAPPPQVVPPSASPVGGNAVTPPPAPVVPPPPVVARPESIVDADLNEGSDVLKASAESLNYRQSQLTQKTMQANAPFQALEMQKSILDSTNQAALANGDPAAQMSYQDGTPAPPIAEQLKDRYQDYYKQHNDLLNKTKPNFDELQQEQQQLEVDSNDHAQAVDAWNAKLEGAKKAEEEAQQARETERQASLDELRKNSDTVPFADKLDDLHKETQQGIDEINAKNPEGPARDVALKKFGEQQDAKSGALQDQISDATNPIKKISKEQGIVDFLTSVPEDAEGAEGGTVKQTAARINGMTEAEVDAAAKRVADRKYSIDSKGGIQFKPYNEEGVPDPKQAQDAISQAEDDGLLDPEETPALQDKLRDAKAKYDDIVKAAGSAQEVKAVLRGVGRGGAFLAGSIPAAKVGGIVGTAVVGGPEDPLAAISAPIGATVFGLGGGMLASWGYDKTLNKLGDYFSSIDSLNKSAQLHPNYAAAGEIASFVAAPTKLAGLVPKAQDFLKGAAWKEALDTTFEGGVTKAFTPAFASSAQNFKELAETAANGAGKPGVSAAIDMARSQAAMKALMQQAGSAAGGAAFFTASQYAMDASRYAMQQAYPETFGNADDVNELFSSEGGKDLASNIGLGLLLHGQGLAFKDYTPRDVAAITTRAEMYNRAGFGYEKGGDPAEVLKAYNDAGIDTDKWSDAQKAEMLKPLSAAEAEVYKNAQKKGRDLLLSGTQPEIKGARQALHGETPVATSTEVEGKGTGAAPPPAAGLPSGSPVGPDINYAASDAELDNSEASTDDIRQARVLRDVTVKGVGVDELTEGELNAIGLTRPQNSDSVKALKDAPQVVHVDGDGKINVLQNAIDELGRQFPATASLVHPEEKTPAQMVEKKPSDMTDAELEKEHSDIQRVHAVVGVGDTKLQRSSDLGKEIQKRKDEKNAAITSSVGTSKEMAPSKETTPSANTKAAALKVAADHLEASGKSHNVAPLRAEAEKLSSEQPKPSPVESKPVTVPKAKAGDAIRNWVKGHLDALPPEQQGQALAHPDMKKVKLVAGALDKIGHLFNDVHVSGTVGKAGIEVDSHGNLVIDPQKLVNLLNQSNDTSVGAVEKRISDILFEEKTHRLSTVLEKESPQFASDLQALWSAVPQETKDQQKVAYHKREGVEFPSDWHAKHEWWADVTAAAERGEIPHHLDDPNLLDKVKAAIKSYLKALKDWLAKAPAEVKERFQRSIQAMRELERKLDEQARNQNKPTAESAGQPAGEVEKGKGEDEAKKEKLATASNAEQQDKDYLAAVEKGDLETAQKMVNEASLMENGWKAKRRENFSTKQLSPSSRSELNEIAENQESIKVTPDSIKRRGTEPIILKHSDGKLTVADGYWRMAQMVAGGHDGEIPVIILEGPKASAFKRSIADYGEDVSDEYSPVYAAADPITRDANGRVIPLSERFNPESNSILYSAPNAEKTDFVEPGFFSQLQKTVAKKMPAVATVEQARAIVEKGSKAEEVKWSGVIPWLEGKEKVSKKELLDYLKGEGAVKFEEHRIGAPQPLTATEKAEQATLKDRFAKKDQTLLAKDAERLGVLNAQSQGYGPSSDFVPAYKQYQLPGGHNYREVVLAMPQKKQESPNEQERQNLIKIGNPTDEQINRLNELNSNYVSTRNELNYTSSHFSNIPNYVAHYRANDRVDADGKEGTLMEELQSDRHQQGREKGYKNDAEFERLEKRWKEVVALRANAEGGEYAALHGEELQLLDAMNALHDGIPDAPFRTTWPLQLFKRALREAVESSKQWIGWTTGDTQNERYDLSKQVDRIEVYPLEKLPGHVAIKAFKDGELVVRHDVPKEQMPDIIGKDAAAKAEEQLTNNKFNGQAILKGDDLKVGGQGMKGFYDNILPKEVGKYVKQWGGRVEQAAIGAPGDLRVKMVGNGDYDVVRPDGSVTESFTTRTKADEWAANNSRVKTPIHRVLITPEMAASVKAGQPLFTSPSADNSGKDSPYEDAVAFAKLFGLTPPSKKDFERSRQQQAADAEGKAELDPGTTTPDYLNGPVANQNAWADAYREAHDLDERGKEVIPDKEAWKRAQSKLTKAQKRGVDAGENLIQNIIAKNRAVANVEEGAILSYELTKRSQEFDAADLALHNSMGQAPDPLVMQRYARAKDRVMDVLRASDVAGEQWGRTGRFRRMGIGEDYSLAGLLKRRMLANGGKPLSEADEKEVRQEHRDLVKLQEATDRVAALEKQNVELEKLLHQAKHAPVSVRDLVKGSLKKAGLSALERLKKGMGLGAAPGAKLKIYRAGDESEVGIKPFSSWSENEETAKAYQDNPGFGGPKLRAESLALSNILDADIRSRTGMRKLAETLGFDADEGEKWFDNGWQYPWEHSKKIKDSLENSSYDLIRYTDDFPQGAKTVVPLKDNLSTAPDTLSAAPPPADNFRDLTIFGAHTIEEGAKDLASFRQAIEKELPGILSGVDVDKLYSASQDLHKETAKSKTPQGVANKIKTKRETADKLTQQDLQKVALSLIQHEGISDVDTLTKRLHEEVAKVFPGMTEDAVAKLWTGVEGEPIKPNPAPAHKTLRELRRLKIAMQRKKMVQNERRLPNKIGPQRDEPTDQIRKEERELADLIKDSGLKPADPATQMKSAQDRLTTALTHRRDDLLEQVAAKKREARSTTATKDTPEIVALRAEIASLNTRLDQLDPRKTGMSQAQKIKMAEAAAVKSMQGLDKEMADLDKLIKAGSIAGAPVKAKPAGLTAPTLDKLRADRKAKAEQRDDMRNLLDDMKDAATVKADPVVDMLKGLKTRQNNQNVPMAPRVRSHMEDLAKAYIKEPTDTFVDDTQKLGMSRLDAEHAKVILDAEVERRKNFADRAAERRMDRTIERLEKEEAGFDADNPVVKKTRKAIALSDARQKKQDMVDQQKLKTRRAEEKMRLRNQTWDERIGKGVARYSRAFLLLDYVVFAKLGSAAGIRMVVTPTEDATFGRLVNTMLPGLAKASARYGPQSWQAELSALTMRPESEAAARSITDMTKTLMHEVWSAVTTGRTSIDTKYGKVNLHDLDKHWTNVIGNLHAAVKVLPKYNEFWRSYQMRVEKGIRDGIDTTSPAFVALAGAASYEDAMRAIYQQDNIISDAWKSSIASLNRSKLMPHTAKAVANAMQTAVPIVKVPTNMALEALGSYLWGDVRAGAILGKIAWDSTKDAKGMEKLTKFYSNWQKKLEALPEKEADNINRWLRRGLFGRAIGLSILMGVLTLKEIGGLWDDRTKERGKDEPKPDHFKLSDGTNVPHFATHAAPFLVANVYGTFRRLLEHGEKDKAKHVSKLEEELVKAQETTHKGGVKGKAAMAERDNLQSSIEALKNSTANSMGFGAALGYSHVALANTLPFIGNFEQVLDASKDTARGDYLLKEMVASRIIPTGVKNAAEQHDSVEGEAIKRKMSSFLDHIQNRIPPVIPGFNRETLPLKNGAVDPFGFPAGTKHDPTTAETAAKNTGFEPKISPQTLSKLPPNTEDVFRAKAGELLNKFADRGTKTYTPITPAEAQAPTPKTALKLKAFTEEAHKEAKEFVAKPENIQQYQRKMAELKAKLTP